MTTKNEELFTTLKIQSGVGPTSGSGKYGQLNTGRRQGHTRMQSGSKDSFTMYASDEGQSINKQIGHKPEARTSEFDLYLQENKIKRTTNISRTLVSDPNLRMNSDHRFNNYDIHNAKVMKLVQREQKSKDEFQLEGPSRQALEACEKYVNKLMKQVSEVREREETRNCFRRNGKESNKSFAANADSEKSWQELSDSVSVSETRARARSRNTCSASEHSSKNNTENVSKRGTQFDNQGHEKYKTVSPHQGTEDTMKTRRINKERGPMNFDPKNRGDSDVSGTASKGDYLRYNDINCQRMYLDPGLKKQHSSHSRNSLNAEKESSQFAGETYSFEKRSKNGPKETMVNRQHEGSRKLRKASGCEYNRGETAGTNRNFSYSQNFESPAELASNSALGKERLWEQPIIEESTISGDTSKCLHSSVEQEFANEPSKCENVLPKKPLLTTNNDQPLINKPCIAQNKACHDWLTGDWKEKNNHRPSANLQRADDLSNDENSKDNSKLRGLWWANAYGTGSSLDTATTSSEDEPVVGSQWTCTKYTDEHSKDSLQQSKTSQWAYEVYSNTCQQFAGDTVKDGKHRTSSHSDSHTPEFDYPCKNVSVSRRDDADVAKSSNCMDSSVTERDRSIWSSKLDYLFDNKINLGKCPDFTDILKDCLQLPPEEISKKQNATKINNRIVTDFTHKVCNDNQESVDDTLAKLDTHSLEKDTSSHNVKGFSDCDKTCSKLESITDAKQTGDKYPKVLKDVSKFMDDPQTMDNLGFDKCKAIQMSPRQTTSNVDEKLMKTVHSIKEDIEGVLQMLNSLDSQGGEKDIAVSILNEVMPVGKPFTVANVNCATDFVKQAFNKLISFKNSFLSKSDEQVESSSYDEYKKGKEDYLSDPDIPEEDYDVENIFYRNVRPMSRGSRASLSPSKVGKSTSKYLSEKMKTDSKSSKRLPQSANRKTDIGRFINKKSAVEKGRLAKKGRLDLGNRSVTELSQYSPLKNVDHIRPHEVHVREQDHPVKRHSHLKPRPKDSGEKHPEYSKHKVWRSAVPTIHGPRGLKHAGAGDRAPLPFASPNSKSRKVSLSPLSNKDKLYAYDKYPLPTFLSSPEDGTDENKHDKRQIKIQVESVVPKRSPAEQDRSKSPKSKTSLTDAKSNKINSSTPPSKKQTDKTGDVLENDVQRNRSYRLADVKKTTSNLINKSRISSPTKDIKHMSSQKLTSRIKGDDKMISFKSQLKTQNTKKGSETNIQPLKSENSPKVIDGNVTDILLKKNDPPGQLTDSLSQEGALEKDTVVNRYLVVSEVTDKSAQGDQTIAVQDDQAKLDITPEPAIVTPSSSRRSKRSGRRRRSRSRSRSRTKRRKRSKVYTEGDNESAKLSTSDNSLFKMLNPETGNQATKTHLQKPSESILGKSTIKGDQDSWYNSDTPKSPSKRAPQSDIDVAKSGKKKSHRTSATGDGRYGSESNADATNETRDWPLEHSNGNLKKKPTGSPLFTGKDKKTHKFGYIRADKSTLELNVSIKKLYEEINKLRLQLEASAEDAVSRPVPEVDVDGPIQFARSYKVFRHPNTIFTPAHKYKAAPDFKFTNLCQTNDQQGTSQHALFDSQPTQQLENTAPNYEPMNEYMAFLESRMKNLENLETGTNIPNHFFNMEEMAENCADYKNTSAGQENNPSSCKMEVSQSVDTAKEVNNWLNEEAYVTASDNSDTQNDVTEKFETAPSDDDFSSCNFKDVKPDGTTGYSAVGSSANNNMRPAELAECPEVIPNYHKRCKAEKQSFKPDKPACFQSDSSKVYEVTLADVDKNEYHHHISSSLNSSGKKDRHCLVELCSETSSRLKEDFSYLPEMNLSHEWDQRSRHQSIAAWADILNSSQNKGSSVGENMPEKLSIHLEVSQGTPGYIPASNERDIDLEQTNNVPFLVKCVQGIFLGSKEATSGMAGSSPQECTFSMRENQSRNGSLSNMPRRKSMKDSEGSGSEVDEVSVGGYIEATRGKQYLRRTHQNTTTLESSPVVNNYLRKKERTPENAKTPLRKYLQGTAAQNRVSLVDTALGCNSGLESSSNQWVPREVIFNRGMNNKNTTLMQEDMPGESQNPHLLESYSLIHTQILETDKVMNHYSDAISAKSSKRTMSRPFSRVSMVSEDQNYMAKQSNSAISENQKAGLRPHNSGKTKDVPKKTPNPDKGGVINSGDDPRSSPQVSEFLSDKEAFPGGAVNADQNSIIASFESMMQKRRPYYVEHCGFRQKKSDSMLDNYMLDTSYCKSGQNELQQMKTTLQVVTVVNDNNSSNDLKPNTVMAHGFGNNEEVREDSCGDTDIDEDIDSENVITSKVALDGGKAFWDNEDIVKTTEVPDTKLGREHKPLSDGDYLGHVKDDEEEAEVDHGKMLLKPLTSITLENGQGDELPAIVIEDCREIFGENIDDDQETLLLDSDEAESWYKITEEESDVKKSDEKINAEGTDDDDVDDDEVVDDNHDDDDDDDDDHDDDDDDDDDDDGADGADGNANVEKEIIDQNRDIDYEQVMSDDDDGYDNNDSWDHDD